MSELNIQSPNSRIGRFVLGFILGGLSMFFSVLLFDQQHLVSALLCGLVFGVLTGGVCSIFGKRVSDFIIELISRLG